MVPGNYDITIYRGGTFEISVEAENAVGVSTDFAATYDSARLQVRPAWNKKLSTNPAALLELTTANGGILIESATPTTLTLYISAADTAALLFDEGRYDLELVVAAVVSPTPAVEKVDKILTGKVSVTGEITV